MSTSRKIQIVVSYKESYCRKNVFFFAIELVEKVMFDKWGIDEKINKRLNLLTLDLSR